MSGGDEVIPPLTSSLQPAGWRLKPERPSSCGVALCPCPGFGTDEVIMPGKVSRVRQDQTLHLKIMSLERFMTRHVNKVNRDVAYGISGPWNKQTWQLGDDFSVSVYLTITYLSALPDPGAGSAPVAFPYPACRVKDSGWKKSIMLTWG